MRPVIDPVCIECGALGRLMAGAQVYPHRPDLHQRLWYVCPCGAKVGCHPGTARPLGMPCSPETSRARDHAHRVFDVIWRDKVLDGVRQYTARNRAYNWLAKELGIRSADCHLSHFDRATCERVVALCAPLARMIAQKRRAVGVST